ncbi:DUF1236 domain-containing protein [Aquamicrobium sp. LC103]|uniref:DUF1236 domain-containing protein n=1 Tax=Aquamicrobium sp. LC103 TaxID=1120658 RepID=UPI00063ED28F|nr:DUF1236 domain-containing protein [Aquamicrobium sp. LC103]TKT79225.1 DUF1236 domain-containing protein [Aquamicrobium sp. LC103]
MRLHLASACALFLMAGSAAAQTVIVAPEQETVIREYITTHEVAPIAPPPDIEIAVGSVLPDAIDVHAIEVPEITDQYGYVVVENRTILVDPQTREIVHIIE